MSRGEDALLYGFPTLVLIKLAGFHPWVLRLFPLLLTLASMLLLRQLVRRFFGEPAGSLTALFFGLNPSVLYYARYGTLAAATTFSAILAVYAACLLMESSKPSWQKVMFTQAALYLATLSYATARLVVLMLLAIVMAWAAYWLSQRKLRPVAAALAIILMSGGIYAAQQYFGRSDNFLRARGEQYFYFLEHRDYLNEFLGKTIEPGRVLTSDKISLLKILLERRLPELLKVFSLEGKEYPEGGGAGIVGDPPHLGLYHFVFLPFMIAGFLLVWRRGLFLPGLFMLAWMMFFSLVMLLTTRVDLHRMSLLVVPLSVWGGLGLAGFYAMLARTSAMQKWLTTVLLLLVCSLFADNLRILNGPSNKVTLLEDTRDFLKGWHSTIFLAARFDHTAVSWLNLALLQSRWKDPELRSELLPDQFKDAASDEVIQNEGLNPKIMPVIAELAGRGDVVLVPAEQFGIVRAQAERFSLKSQIFRRRNANMLMFSGR